MRGLHTIPKVVASDPSEIADQKIPRIIWQTMKTNHVPRILKDIADSWITQNREYEYRFCDDEDILEFLQADFPDYFEAYGRIRHGASKADLWRYLAIYKHGGVYADSDCWCRKPMREWVRPESKYVTQFGINHDVCQWLIVSAPGNPILIRAAEIALENLNRNRFVASYRGFELIEGEVRIRSVPPVVVDDEVFGLAGPPVMQQAAEECFENGSLGDWLDVTQVMCVSGCRSCQMAGNVHHDCGNKQYLRALKRLKTNHYEAHGGWKQSLERFQFWK